MHVPRSLLENEREKLVDEIIAQFNITWDEELLEA
jgi:hypothetical protein